MKTKEKEEEKKKNIASGHSSNSRAEFQNLTVIPKSSIFE